ncbi:MAG: hypothetical protein JXR91_00070 [Deltaproteobacteria bacterium]|nr:hypothetical protein [Deltaproteobacteria bacterium]
MQLPANRYILIAELFLLPLIFVFLSTTAYASDDKKNRHHKKAGILILIEKNSAAALESEKIISNLETEFKAINLEVSTRQTDALPDSYESWQTSKYANVEKPGILAVIAWKCSEKNSCNVYIFETESKALSVIPVTGKPGEEPESKDDTVNENSLMTDPVTKTITSAVNGPLIFELGKIKKTSESYTEGNSQKDKIKYVPYDERLDTASAPQKVSVYPYDGRGIVLDVSYAGAYPYPSANTVHGILFGETFYFNENIGTGLSAGWMGVRKGSGQNGTISENFFPLFLTLRLSFPMGKGFLSIIPTAKLDLIVLSKQPVKKDKQNSFTSEFSFGGQLLWNLPSKSRILNFIAGASIFATLASKDLNISDETILRATTFQFLWVAGISFDLRKF